MVNWKAKLIDNMVIGRDFLHTADTNYAITLGIYQEESVATEFSQAFMA